LSTQDTSAFGNVLADSSVINALDPRLAHPFKVGFATSMDLVFLLGAIVCAAGLFILLFMPEVHLSSRSAQQRAADDAAARAAGVPGPTTGAQRTVTHDLVDAVTAEAGGHSLDELPDAGEAYQTRPRS
jgi:hypothetical protein